MMWLATRNAAKRPRVIHAVDSYDSVNTSCGQSIDDSSSLFYMSRPLGIYACLNCVRIVGYKL